MYAKDQNEMGGKGEGVEHEERQMSIESVRSRKIRNDDDTETKIAC